MSLEFKILKVSGEGYRRYRFKTFWPWIKARILPKSHSVISLCWSVDWSVNSLPNFRILLSRLAMVKFVAYSGLSFDTNLRFFPQNSKLWEIFTNFKHISTYCRMTINVACQTSRLQRASVRVCGSATLSLLNQPTITTTAYLDKAGKNAASQVGVNAQLCGNYPNIHSNIFKT